MALHSEGREFRNNSLIEGHTAPKALARILLTLSVQRSRVLTLTDPRDGQFFDNP